MPRYELANHNFQILPVCYWPSASHRPQWVVTAAMAAVTMMMVVVVRQEQSE